MTYLLYINSPSLAPACPLHLYLVSGLKPSAKTFPTNINGISKLSWSQPWMVPRSSHVVNRTVVDILFVTALEQEGDGRYICLIIIYIFSSRGYVASSFGVRYCHLSCFFLQEFSWGTPPPSSLKTKQRAQQLWLLFSTTEPQTTNTE